MKELFVKAIFVTVAVIVTLTVVYLTLVCISALICGITWLCSPKFREECKQNKAEISELRKKFEDAKTQIKEEYERMKF